MLTVVCKDIDDVEQGQFDENRWSLSSDECIITRLLDCNLTMASKRAAKQIPSGNIPNYYYFLNLLSNFVFQFFNISPHKCLMVK